MHIKPDERIRADKADYSVERVRLSACRRLTIGIVARAVSLY
jgi:hypothetical protein